MLFNGLKVLVRLFSSPYVVVVVVDSDLVLVHILIAAVDIPRKLVNVCVALSIRIDRIFLPVSITILTEAVQVVNILVSIIVFGKCLIHNGII